MVLSDFGIHASVRTGTDNNNIHVDIYIVYEKIRTTELPQLNCDDCGWHATKINQ